jgi:hypothetical protein
MARRTSLLLVLLLLPVLLAGSPVAGSPPSSADPVPFFFGLNKVDYPFSPNGDGHRDFAVGVYGLSHRAHVSLLVKRRSLIDVIDLGLRSAGVHQTWWDGTDGDGHVLREGIYGLRLVARELDGTVLRSDWDYATIDLTIRPGEVLSDWPVVYPRAHVVRDRVWIRYLAATAHDTEWGKVRGHVVDQDGDVVARLHWDDADYTCDFRAGRFVCGYAWSWSGRRHGRPLAQGWYRVEVVANDKAGNRFGESTRVRVSDRQLAASVQTVTVSAADSVQQPHYPAACNGCGDDTTCGDVITPGRFGTGSLSYRSADTCTYLEMAAREYHEALYSPAPAGGDYRLTAYGGPATPGGQDQGALLLGFEVRVPTGADTSDHETSTPWTAPSDRWRTASATYWGFETLDHAAYDVAWFRVEVTTYRPVS